MQRARVLAAIVLTGITVAGVAAQRGPRIPPTGAIMPVKANLYVIHGAGGNTTVFVTAAGVVLVDTKLANNGEAIMKQVKTVTDKPVSMIINTHTHPDHNGSNDYFKDARPSIEIVTHENTKKWVDANPQSKPAMKPDKTFSDKLTLGKGKDQIDLYWFGAAHTNGDAFVVFKALRAMCVGDVMAWKMAPLIDPATGGSVIALPDTLEKAVKGIKNVDTVIEGHGDVNTWAGFRDYARFNRALLDAAKAGLGKKTPEDIAASLKSAFPLFTKEELLPEMEYGGTPLSRAVINVNVAFQELRGEPVTTNFGPPRAGGPGRGGAGTPPPGR
jgi:cyclase